VRAPKMLTCTSSSVSSSDSSGSSLSTVAEGPSTRASTGSCSAAAMRTCRMSTAAASADSVVGLLANVVGASGKLPQQALLHIRQLPDLQQLPRAAAALLPAKLLLSETQHLFTW
jgi:hypothetical protein